MKLPRLPQPNKSKSTEGSSRALQVLQRKLAQNALTEFKIGFDNDEFRSKRDVQSLIKTIEEQYLQKLAMDKLSCLESIRIGWKLPNFALGPVLQQIVPLLMQRPAKVLHLQLMINSWVPLPTIQRLVSWPTLETLDLRSLRVRTRVASEPSPQHHSSRIRRHHRSVERRSYSPKHNRSVSNSSSPNSTVKADAAFEDDGAMIRSDESILNALPYISPSITTLKLVDCDLKVQHMSEMIQILRKKRNLHCLSLRHNRRLCLDGWQSEILQQMPFLRALDLSICDLSPFDGLRLAKSLRDHANTCQLKSLSIAGNFRLDEAIPDIVDACASSGVFELECSYCDISNKSQEAVFHNLATNRPCHLRSLKMQATRVANIPSLIRCIEQNESLERLLLNHPREPSGIRPECLVEILCAMRNNYYLGEFQIDLPWILDEQVLQEMEYWMTLNRCGRSILVNDRRRNWPNVLAAVDQLGDIDIFHSILRRGAEQFHVQGVV